MEITECGHEFGLWSMPFDATKTEAFGSFGDTTAVPTIKQMRVCPKCKRIDVRDVCEGRICNSNVEGLSLSFRKILLTMCQCGRDTPDN